VISLTSVNQQLKTIAPQWELCIHPFTSNIEIQYTLPNFTPKALYLNVRSPYRWDLSYAKISFSGELIELYPTIDPNWTVTDTIPTCATQVIPFQFNPVMQPYASYDVKAANIDAIYTVESLEATHDSGMTYVRGHRRNLDASINREYHRIHCSQFGYLANFWNPNNAQWATSDNPNMLILYSNGSEYT